jgi:hypothetical protein
LTIDHDYFDRLRRYEDTGSGIAEEFLPDALGPGGGTAILSTPLGECRAPGWVLCSALAKERSFLRRLEALVARTLAAAGFPAIRIRGGAEDPDRTTRELDVGARIAEADAAVAALRSRTGVADVGTAGALAGGLVAAVVADRLELPYLAAVDPVVRGRQFVRDALRRQSASALVKAETADRPAPARRALEELEEQGWTTIRGFRLTREANEQLQGLDLLQELQRFRGSALLVHVTRGGDPPRSLVELGDHLRALGATVELQAVEDALVFPFGESYLRNVGYVRRDTRIELDRALADTLVSWLRHELEPAGGI